MMTSFDFSALPCISTGLTSISLCLLGVATLTFSKAVGSAVLMLTSFTFSTLPTYPRINVVFINIRYDNTKLILFWKLQAVQYKC
jgi:hypothetical protein